MVAPTLSGLETNVTFGENLVNATPQILDSAVVFADADNDFNGGRLTVSGLLAEDRITVNNQGTTVGLVGVSGANISFGGTTIGSFTGGSGATFTLTFNASATATAVDAVIQNLLYANVSNTPTASRTLTVNVIDATGNTLLGASAFTAVTGAASPFDGVDRFDTGYFAAPTFFDIDGDGDLDAVIGTYYGTQNLPNVTYGGLFTYRNNGPNTAFTPSTAAANPFDEIIFPFQRTAPTFVNLDGDGDLDLVVGDLASGTLLSFRNNGNNTFTQLTGAANPFNTTPINGIFAKPTFFDFDGDGDLDAVVGVTDAGGGGDSAPEVIRVFRNNGVGNQFSEVTGTANPFSSITLENQPTPAFIDLDGDGDLDLVVGTYTGTIRAYRNNGVGNAFTNIAAGDNPFNGIDVGATAAPSFVDIDGDGDLDAVIGGSEGQMLVYRNATAVAALPTITITVTAQDDPATAVNDNGGSLLANATTNFAVLTNDVDPDGGPPPVVATINGATAVVGTAITLASGATATLQANGTITYNPNGAFNGLISTATAASTGATNTQATDSFNYTITGGSQATVTVTVNGADGAGDRLLGNGGANTINGTGGADYIDMSQGGADTANGGGGDDGLYFGAAFGAGDVANGGAGINDQLGLQGNYTGGTAVTLNSTNTIGVEVVAVLPGAGFNYSITTADDLIADGATMRFFAARLLAGQVFTLNGAGETNGQFLVYGGGGTDLITTGAGNDGIYFGPGAFDPAVDVVNAGGGTNDQVAFDSNFTGTIGGANFQNVEVLALLRGIVGDLATYNITLADSLLTGTNQFTVYGIPVETALVVNGSAEATGGIRIFGGSGADTLTGGGGNDILWGNFGNDTLRGNGGADQFLFANTPAPGNVDQIVDFTAAQGDKIALNQIAFSMAAGSLATGAFVVGTAALDADDRIIYNGSTGALLFDADGNGAGAAVQFATLTGNPLLTAADFVIV